SHHHPQPRPRGRPRPRRGPDPAGHRPGRGVAEHHPGIHVQLRAPLRRGITRLHNVRPEVTILCDIATRLLADCPVDFTAFKSHGKIREAIAATVPGLE